MNAEPINQHALLDAPVTQGQARPTLEQLRVERAAGRVTETDYFKRFEYLIAKEGGQDVEVPNLRPTPQQQLEAGIVESMKPGEVHEYVLPQDPMKPMTEEGRAFDTELRHALTDLKIPTRLGGPIVERVEQVARALGQLDPETREVKIETFRRELRAKWGDDYGPRTDAIQDWIATATAKHEQVGELLDAAPWILCDVAVNEWLWSVVDFNERK